jgi:hypothetical protein
MQVLILLMAVTSALFAGLCWITGTVEPFAHIQVGALLTILIALNLAPPLAELIYRRLDPFDAKHLFLGYFFVIFGLHSFCEIALGMAGDPAIVLPGADSSLRIHTLSAIVLCLATFVIGCYIPLGGVIAHLIPRIPAISVISKTRVKVLALGGVALGLLAFYELIYSAGGIVAFLNDLGGWRTLGVLAGIGYLTFPISVVMPAGVMLLLLYHLPLRTRRFKWSLIWIVPLLLISLGQILILGFRINLVPVVLLYFAAWHYMQRHIRISQIIVLAAGLFMFLTVYGLLRSASDSGKWTTGLGSVLFRVPGIDLVERVVWRMGQGEPHRGVLPMITESATILVPRAVWPGKPAPEGLMFADIFFYDFFIGRGDPIDGVKSGVSPTIVGSALWIGGIQAVVVVSLMLGLSARIAVVWRQLGHGHRLHIYVYAVFMAYFAIFVEAPEIALNNFVMLGVLSLLIVLLLTVNLRRTPRTFLTGKHITQNAISE